MNEHSCAFLCSYSSDTKVIQMELSLPYFSQPSGCIHSVTEITALLSSIWQTPKFPSLAPRSGVTITSVCRRSVMVSGSTCAMKRGAR